MVLTRKMSYQAPSAGNQAASMKFMDIGMPLISVIFSFQVPAMLGLYWIYTSLVSVLKQFILKKIFPYPEFTDEEYKAAEKQYMSGTKVDRASLRKAEASGRIASHRIDLLPEEETESANTADNASGKNGGNDDSDTVELEAPVKLKQEKSADDKSSKNKDKKGKK